MSKAMNLWLLAGCAAVSVLTGPAAAASFTIIASVGGGQIGAVSGDTLYGTAPYNGSGQLFSLTTSGIYTLLHDFTAGTDGSAPNARLVMDGTGNVFGTTPSGGVNGGGTLWKYSAEGVMSTPHAFGAAGDGVEPLQGPTMGPHGTVFGTTAMGAANTNGIIFSMAHAGGYATVYNFLSDADGHCPFSGVAVTKAGAIYGTTVGRGYGGNPNGSVWKYTAAAGLTTLYMFTDGADGEWPDQAPVVDRDGNVYGTTHVQNGNSFPGAIWKISRTGVFSVLHDLNSATDGDGPNSPLLIDTKNTLYGTTASGGTGGYGTVFSITPSGKFETLHAFANQGDGAQPTGNLVRDSSGAIYGGTAYGPVFKIVP